MKYKNLVENKALGIMLTEDQARRVDQLVKDLPSDCTYKRKGVIPEQVELNESQKYTIGMVSTESVDREGEVILAKGMNVELYQLNPIVLFSHRMDELPVGRNEWLKKVKGGLRAKTVYSDATETSRAVWQLTKEGILKAFSVGFLPTKIRSASKEELQLNPHWKDASAIVEEAYLLEYSVCSVPVNQNALVESISKGRTDRAILKQLGLEAKVKPLSEKRIADIIAKEMKEFAKELSPDKIREAMLEKYRA